MNYLDKSDFGWCLISTVLDVHQYPICGHGDRPEVKMAHEVRRKHFVSLRLLQDIGKSRFQWYNVH